MYASVNQELKVRIDVIKKDYAAAYQDSKAKNRRMDWLSWLVKESRLGNQEALEILRARKEDRAPENKVSPIQMPEDSVKPDFIETITRTGTIICTIGSTAIRDGGNGLVIMAGAARDKIAGILQAAMKQYGNRLTINGSESFRKKIVQVAMDANLDVTFDEQDHSIHHSVKPRAPLKSIRSTHKGKGRSR
jgi:hypothetical protein